jgi:2-oxoglutarate ferredoxin oxidoreductase subunit alpha
MNGKALGSNSTKNKRPHNIANSLYLLPEELERLVFERYERYAQIEKNETMYEEYLLEDAEICVAAYGAAPESPRMRLMLPGPKESKQACCGPLPSGRFQRKHSEKPLRRSGRL